MSDELEIGSVEYFVKLLRDCHQGVQRCHECHILSCGDNMHPSRISGLMRTVLDFVQERYIHQRKIARLEEILRSSYAVTNRLQKDAMRILERTVELRELIERSTREAQLLDERLSSLEYEDADTRTHLQELEAFIEGLERAEKIMIRS